MKTPFKLEPKGVITLSKEWEDYLASQEDEVEAQASEEVIEEDDEAQAEALSEEDGIVSHVENTTKNEGEEATTADDNKKEPRHHTDASLIQPLLMLQPEARAKTVRLLKAKTNSDYNLAFAEHSGFVVQHTSLKRLGTAGWLNDEVINAINMHFLRPKVDKNSFFYATQFMSTLLQTGSHGTDEPNYNYSKVKGWSTKIKKGLFNLENLYIPINHKNTHWLTMRINVIKKIISLWDSQGVKQENVLYTIAALRYFGDEYSEAYLDGNLLELFGSWEIQDLSDDSP